jgi:putative aminopeptidase FrvX
MKKVNPALDLLQLPTAPGFEDLPAEFIQEMLRRWNIALRTDRYGNIVACLNPKSKKATVAFAVHMDHPGFKVLRVHQKEIECLFLGGVPREYFRKGVAVEFFNPRGIRTGIARMVRPLEWKARKRPCLLRWESGSVVQGQFGMWKLIPFRFNRSSKRIISRAIDDLGGCAAVLATLANLVQKKSSSRVYAVFTRREEVGLEGAYEVARARLLPKSVPIISIETSKALANARQGDGPIVRVGDRTSIFDPGLTRQLCEVGKSLVSEGSFKFQRKLMDGGTCEATAYLEGGYAATGICVALGNYHNCGANRKIAAEYIHSEDWNQMVQLMTATAERLK